MGIDLVFIDQLAGLATTDIGFGFIVGDDQFDRTAVDAAHAVDAIDRHLHADQRGLAAGSAGA